MAQDNLAKHVKDFPVDGSGRGHLHRTPAARALLSSQRSDPQNNSSRPPWRHGPAVTNWATGQNTRGKLSPEEFPSAGTHGWNSQGPAAVPELPVVQCNKHGQRKAAFLSEREDRGSTHNWNSARSQRAPQRSWGSPRLGERPRCLARMR